MLIPGDYTPPSVQTHLTQGSLFHLSKYEMTSHQGSLGAPRMWAPPHLTLTVGTSDLQFTEAAIGFSVLWN